MSIFQQPGSGLCHCVCLCRLWTQRHWDRGFSAQLGFCAFINLTLYQIFVVFKSLGYNDASLRHLLYYIFILKHSFQTSCNASASVGFAGKTFNIIVTALSVLKMDFNQVGWGGGVFKGTVQAVMPRLCFISLNLF